MTKAKAVCLFVMVALFALTVAAQAAAPRAKISLQAVAPRDTVGPAPNRTATGLPNVAVGSMVYLVGGASAADTVITGYAWTLTGPTGSTAALSDPAIQNPTFSPDIAGQYLVGLVVTDAKGQVSAQTTLWINAGTYVGVGTVGNKTATFPQCGLGCHVQQEQKWHHTRHALIFQEGIDGELGNYTASCIACHTTGYDRNAAAVNGGFDDVAAAVGWTFPDTLKAGNWDTLVAKYPNLAQLAVIGCESCHGPGSAHGGAHDKNQIHKTYDNGPCAVCHNAGTRHFRPYQWDLSAHSLSDGLPGRPGYMNRVECARCHIAQGFVEETIKGKASAAPYVDFKPITCAACHDPHDATAEHQLRRGSVAEACTGCHVLRISSRGLHHSHQTDMLEGKSGWEYPGQVYLNSAHSEIEEKCAVCHMARAPQEPWVLPQDTLVGGHTFKAYNDRGTEDISDDVVNTWGCVDCHGQVSPAFVHLSQEGIKALLDTLAALLPKDPTTGLPIVHVKLDPKLYTKAEIAGAYNYYFVLNDGSYGVHNHRYAEKLLRDAIKEIKATAGAGNIVDIADVPNDQGKQVHIIWGAFPAEQSAINPIINYGVWRRNDSGATSGAVPVTSFKEMLMKVSPANAGGQYLVAGSSVWDFVGFVPAAGHDRYGYVAPTLFDSTKVSGMHWSVFYISGHTSDPAIVYESLPDSGYSVDNLVPTAPTGVVIATVGNQNRLKWDDPVDADFNYFAVYRSTTPNFDPTGTQPIARVTSPEYTDTNVLVGTRYYYKLSAFDFSGNEGKYSEEVSVVTGVEGRGRAEVPKEFALEQNFPNPFNPETLIKFSLPKSAHVRLTVYTLLGQPVRTLIDAERSAGYHQVTWDGRDSAGNPLASGIYVYRIEAGEFSAMKKMILMK